MRMFARPRFVFLCVGDADTIHERKPELLPEEIERTIDLYREKLAKYDIPREEVNTTRQSEDAVCDQVVRSLNNNGWYRGLHNAWQMKVGLRATGRA